MSQSPGLLPVCCGRAPVQRGCSRGLGASGARWDGDQGAWRGWLSRSAPVCAPLTCRALPGLGSRWAAQGSGRPGCAFSPIGLLKGFCWRWNGFEGVNAFIDSSRSLVGFPRAVSIMRPLPRIPRWTRSRRRIRGKCAELRRGWRNAPISCAWVRTGRERCNKKPRKSGEVAKGPRSLSLSLSPVALIGSFSI